MQVTVKKLGNYQQFYLEIPFSLLDFFFFLKSKTASDPAAKSCQFVSHSNITSTETII